MIPSRTPLLLAAFLLILTTAATLAGPAPAPEAFRSEILDETLTLSITTPPSYEATDRRYPVLVILEDDLYRTAMDGTIETWTRLGLMPEMIVVGVPTTDRWRDYTPTRAGVPGGDVIPNSGGGRRHRDFLARELLPHLDAGWRTQPFRILYGHSIAGLHALDVFQTEGSPFAACIATSPSLWWDDEMLTEELPSALARADDRPRALFLAIGGEDATMLDPLLRYRDGLERGAPEALRWTYRRYEGALHPQVPLKAFTDALDFVFEGWTLPPSALDGGIAAVDAHYAGLSRRFGYAIDVPESTLNRLGYVALGAGDLDGALAVFRRNAAAHPASANTHDSLGEALLAAGDTTAARREYRRALELAPQSRSAVEALHRLGDDADASTRR